MRARLDCPDGALHAISGNRVGNPLPCWWSWPGVPRLRPARWSPCSTTQTRTCSGGRPA